MADLSREKKPHTCLGYTLLDKLGGGGFAFARVGFRKHKDHEEFVAIKFIKYQKPNQLLAKCRKTGRLIQIDEEGKQITKITSYMKRTIQELNTEILSLQSIRHENVVQLVKYKLNHNYKFSSGQSHNCIAVVLELCPYGELFDLIIHCALDEKTSRTLFRQICSGLDCLHKHHICHRDIKPQNLLLAKDLTVKIADFGSAKRWDNERHMETVRVGTKGFQAPELCMGRHYTAKCDVFSLAVTLFVMLTRKMPFKDQPTLQDDYYVLIAGKQFDMYWKLWKKGGYEFSNSLQDLLCKMLCYQPTERIGMKDVLEHPWTAGEIFPQKEMKNVLGQKMRIARARRNRLRNPKDIDSETFRGRSGPPELPTLPAGREFFAMQMSKDAGIAASDSTAERHLHPSRLLDYVAQVMEVDDTRAAVDKVGPAHYTFRSKVAVEGDDPSEEAIEIDLRGYQSAKKHEMQYYVDLHVLKGSGLPATIQLVDTIFDYLGAPRST